MLVSALLFVGASVCIKKESYNEKRRNLPYIMPGRLSGDSGTAGKGAVGGDKASEIFENGPGKRNGRALLKS